MTNNIRKANPNANKPILRVDPGQSRALKTDAPYSQEAEEALLGAILIHPAVIPNIANQLDAEDFFFLRHGYIWKAIQAVHNRREAVDLVTVVSELNQMGHLNDIGGPAFLTQLLNNTPSSRHYHAYFEVVKRDARRRQWMQEFDTMRELARDTTKSIDELEDHFAERVALQRYQQPDDMTHVMPWIEKHMDMVEQAASGVQRAVYGIPSGIEAFDKLLDGFHKNWLYVLAGIQHHGKTAVMLSAALNAAKAGNRVLYFNTSDGDTLDIINRMIAMEIGVAPNKIKTVRMTPQEHSRYVTAVGRMSRLPLYVQTRPGISPRQILDQATRIYQQGGVDIIFVDYLQGMSIGDEGSRRYPNRIDQIDYILESLDKMSKRDRFDCPVVVGSQINRQGKNSKKPPSLSRAKGSGRIEELAGVGVVIWHEHLVNNSEPKGKLKLIVEKNKVNGQIGTVLGRLNEDTTLVRDWEKTTRTIDLGDES